MHIVRGDDELKAADVASGVVVEGPERGCIGAWSELGQCELAMYAS